MADDHDLLGYTVQLVEEMMNDKIELQQDYIRMMDVYYIRMNNEKQIELNDKTIENQDWMIKFLLLELKDTIITKNKKIAAWRSTALKCAPPTSGLHKFADEKDVPDVDEEFLEIINDILKKQKTVPGATQFPEYADSSKGLLTNEGKAAFNDFLKKHKTVTKPGAEPAVEKNTTNWKNNFQNPTSWTLGTYFVISLLIWFLF